MTFTQAALPENPTTLPLWSGTPPNHLQSDLVEVVENDGLVKRISRVQTPTIEIRLPARAQANGRAVVVCPGGGYGVVVYDWEGIDTASMLNAQGIAAIILKYRLPEDASNVEPSLSPLLDASRALRLTRFHAADWGINPNQIGIMGFSAGGHVASTLGTHFDAGNPSSTDPVERLSSRPDFMVLIYPVISMQADITHPGSRKNLLGDSPSEEMLTLFSNEKQVTPQTPQTFIIHSSDDTAVPVKNSLLFYEALLANGVETEMHLYPYGGHGYSLALGRGRLSDWPSRCIQWINTIDL